MIRKIFISGIMIFSFVCSTAEPCIVFATTTDNVTSTNTTTDEYYDKDLAATVSENMDFYLYGSGRNIEENKEVNNVFSTTAASNSKSISNAAMIKLLATESDAAMKTGSDGLELIKTCEGFSAKAYRLKRSDGSYEKYYTIGYGHYGPDVEPDMVITKKEGEKLLKSDLKVFENAVNKFITTHKLSYNQNQFDALISYTYNLGTGWTTNTAKAMYIAQTNGYSNYHYMDIVGLFELSNTGGGIVMAGLTRRRRAEAAIFLNDVSKTVYKTDKKYEVSYDGLKVRTGPGTNYSTVKDSNGKDLTFEKGKTITITEVKETSGNDYAYKQIYWGKCSKGWVSLDYCNYYLTGTYKTIANSLSIREKPDVNSKQVGTLKKGKYIYLSKLDVRGRWGKCSKGWVSLNYCRYITLKKPVITEVKNSTTEKAITLTWDKVSYAGGYIIYRKAGSGSYIRIAELGSGSTLTFTDTLDLTCGTKYTYKIEAFRVTDEKTLSSSASKTMYNYYVSGKKISDLSVKKKVVTVSWTKHSKVTGYQLSYANNSSFKKATKIKITSNKTLSAKTTTLAKGTYYFRLRTYLTVDGVKYYSKWSSVKKVTIK